MSDLSPRYVVLYQHTSDVKMGGESLAHGFILDRWYSHRELLHVVVPESASALARLAVCEEIAAAWEAEHDAWLTSVDVTPPTRKDGPR